MGMGGATIEAKVGRGLPKIFKILGISISGQPKILKFLLVAYLKKFGVIWPT